VANPGGLSAFPYDFLIWGDGGEALEGVTIEALNARHSLLVQGAAYETGFHTHIMKPQFAVIQAQRFVSRPIFWK
jgi:hypothetical protein